VSRPCTEVGEPCGRLARSLRGDLLGELDDQSVGTADAAEPVAALLVILALADRLEALVPRSLDDRLEVVDLEAMCR
jgi:hypothetical protein